MAKVNNVASVETTVTEVPFDREQYIKDQGGVSKAIRQLAKDGKSRGEIAKLLDKRYQHVRNVLIQPLKKG